MDSNVIFQSQPSVWDIWTSTLEKEPDECPFMTQSLHPTLKQDLWSSLEYELREHDPTRQDEYSSLGNMESFSNPTLHFNWRNGSESYRFQSDHPPFKQPLFSGIVDVSGYYEENGQIRNLPTIDLSVEFPGALRWCDEASFVAFTNLSENLRSNTSTRGLRETDRKTILENMNTRFEDHVSVVNDRWSRSTGLSKKGLEERVWAVVEYTVIEGNDETINVRATYEGHCWGDTNVLELPSMTLRTINNSISDMSDWENPLAINNAIPLSSYTTLQQKWLDVIRNESNGCHVVRGLDRTLMRELSVSLQSELSNKLQSVVDLYRILDIDLVSLLPKIDHLTLDWQENTGRYEVNTNPSLPSGPCFTGTMTVSGVFVEDQQEWLLDDVHLSVKFFPPSRTFSEAIQTGIRDFRDTLRSEGEKWGLKEDTLRSILRNTRRDLEKQTGAFKAACSLTVKARIENNEHRVWPVMELTLLRGGENTVWMAASFKGWFWGDTSLIELPEMSSRVGCSKDKNWNVRYSKVDGVTKDGGNSSQDIDISASNVPSNISGSMSLHDASSSLQGPWEEAVFAEHNNCHVVSGLGPFFEGKLQDELRSELLHRYERSTFDIMCRSIDLNDLQDAEFSMSWRDNSGCYTLNQNPNLPPDPMFRGIIELEFAHQSASGGEVTEELDIPPCNNSGPRYILRKPDQWVAEPLKWWLAQRIVGDGNGGRR
ncbi:hypothetical protein TREMEDRAFT_61799 [Tremella mesenterica DSM 1558]|uniref:uncharacterized protein n=1 Tax=Tremella mesenterica (strain ATCC 24925 / CBS 8224 / DSM 1558 / NBRC 9311 / NRRL Y-6157 / RJB 2259-6 / UBC 559-6) TaxID=578456 RepID=UPI0003F49DCD|nr:uncharacterized protein TREMEDRAFT_61799 [Tremella mesenterica DSM 1558]EIW70036.1 hypothetical protein TREMEDRAFT_61799 [Tremella mesenterica DSM 1558]